MSWRYSFLTLSVCIPVRPLNVDVDLISNTGKILCSYLIEDYLYAINLYLHVLFCLNG